jgi:phosphonoacetaldehyde hydrolase
MTLSLQAVVFDWAGTMVDFGCRAPVRALQDVLRGAGLDPTEAEVRRDMGMAKIAHIRALLAMPRLREAWTARHGRAPDEADVARLHDAVEPLMRAAAAECAELIPGAAEVVSELRAQGIKIGSGTGYTRTMMAEILPRAAAMGYAPDVVVCSGETPVGRPSPLPFWKALIELGAWPAHACVKVDDAVVGVAEGRAAGAWTIGLAASGNGVGLGLADYQALEPRERRGLVDVAGAALTVAGADFVIDSVADLPAVILEIQRRLAGGLRPRFAP